MAAQAHAQGVADAGTHPGIANGGAGTAAEGKLCVLCREPCGQDPVIVSKYTARCRSCNTSRSAVGRLFGSWPCSEFAALSEGDKAMFWQELKKDGSGRTIAQNAVHSLAKHVSKIRRITKEGSYQPLEYYERLGYSIKTIEKECTDTDEHPILGKTYRVVITSKMEEEREEIIRSQLFEKIGAARAVNHAKTAAASALAHGDTSFKFGGSTSSDADDSDESYSLPSLEPSRERSNGKRRGAKKQKSSGAKVKTEKKNKKKTNEKKQAAKARKKEQADKVQERQWRKQVSMAAALLGKVLPLRLRLEAKFQTGGDDAGMKILCGNMKQIEVKLQAITKATKMLPEGRWVDKDVVKTMISEATNFLKA